MNEDAARLFAGHPDTAVLYETVEEAALSLGDDVGIRAGRTQVAFHVKKGFAWAWLPIRRIKGRPEVYLVLSFGLDRKVESPRILETVQPYPGRWMHHLLLERPGDLDAEVLFWLRDAYRQAGGRY